MSLPTLEIAPNNLFFSLYHLSVYGSSFEDLVAECNAEYAAYSHTVDCFMHELVCGVSERRLVCAPLPSAPSSCQKNFTIIWFCAAHDLRSCPCVGMPGVEMSVFHRSYIRLAVFGNVNACTAEQATTLMQTYCRKKKRCIKWTACSDSCMFCQGNPGQMQ